MSLEEPDYLIVSKVLSGDKSSFGDIVRRYEDKLGRYIRRFAYDNSDSVDILQNVFIKAYQNLNSYDKKLSFNSWIYRIAHNESINFLKKNHKIGVSFVDFDTIAPSLFARETADEMVINEEIKKEIEEVLSKIPPKYKEIIILSYYEELSYDEISEILKVPISTVGTRIRRAKEKIKVELEKKQNK